MKTNVIIVIITFLFFSCDFKKPLEIKKGQKWVKEYNVNNPFEEVERDTVIILEVQGDYIKFKRNGEVGSHHKHWIRVSARLLE
jgi:hypothetical protein